MEKKIVNVKDFYPIDRFQYAEKLTTGELTVLKNLRTVLENEVKPKIDEAWETAKFPMEAFRTIGKVGIMNDPLLFEDRTNKRSASQLYNVFLYFELAKADPSMATFYTVHGGLCYNTILSGGSEEQIAYYAPKIANFEWQGCFALTEPEHGSDIAGGLATSAKKAGDKWILNGEKRWIGGAATADIIPVFARDEADGQVKCFIVEGGSEGLTTDLIQGKISLRALPNANIHLNNVVVPDSARLVNINSFKDVAKILRITRADITHLATGVTAGSFESALDYVRKRDQFGKKIASFQLVQEKLARMQANLMANLAYSVRLAELQEEGVFLEENSALAKMHNAMRMRETVALGREICGGNGISLEYNVARFFADAEGIYSYEGTHEINSLIVGRFLTGKSSFV